MAVAFRAEQKRHIEHQLLDTGEELFTTQGLKKTSLDELVGPAGIAKGSFYAFFDSKESLYLEVMLRRAPQIGAHLSAALQRPPTPENLVMLMRTITEILVTDPLYRRLLTRPEELAAVSRRLGAEHVARVAPRVMTPLIEYVSDGQRAGLLSADFPAETIVGVIRSVGLIVVHRDQFGPAYEQVLEATITTLARGMIA